MRNLILIALLAAAAAPAAAQPVTSPGACAVTISRAPDDVRLVVEAWVKAEPRCASSIDVRIIPTDGGLYILAQDDRGGVRERIVPDAQSAGVLIASWVADDTFPPDKTVVFVPEHAPPSLSDPTHEAMPVGGTAAFVDAPPTAHARGTLPRWLSVGLMLAPHEGDHRGVRAEVDVLTWTRWSAGVALSRTASFFDNFAVGMPENYEWRATHDTKAVGYLARTMRSGRWQLRAAGGAGLVWTRMRGMYSRDGGAWTTFATDESKLSPTAEGSLLAAVRIGNWALHAGPVFTIYAQAFTSHQQNVWEPMTETVKRSEIETLLWTGLRHSL